MTLSSLMRILATDDLALVRIIPLAFAFKTTDSKRDGFEKYGRIRLGGKRLPSSQKQLRLLWGRWADHNKKKRYGCDGRGKDRHFGQMGRPQSKKKGSIARKSDQRRCSIWILQSFPFLLYCSCNPKLLSSVDRLFIYCSFPQTTYLLFSLLW